MRSSFKTVCVMLVFVTFSAGFLVMTAHAQGAAQTTGYAVKKPIIQGGPPGTPWGTLAEIVKTIMKPKGWDLQHCYYCNGAARAARLVSKAAMATPPEKPSPEDLPTPKGPIDFGVTGAEFLQWAYMGTNDFTKDPGTPQKQLRLIANVQEPTFLILAVTADSGITDLRQIQEKRMPVKVVSNRGIGGLITPTVLEYYGLTAEKLKSFGGSITGRLEPQADANVFIGFGSVAQVPEFSLFFQAAQRYDLRYLSLAPDLKTKLMKEFNLGEAQLPIGMFGKVTKPVPSLTRMGTSIFGRTDMPDEFAYTLAKALDENQELLAWTQMNWSYNRHTVWKNLDVPLHAGAARYYKEAGYMK
jgi:uncharacterized protein